MYYNELTKHDRNLQNYVAIIDQAVNSDENSRIYFLQSKAVEQKFQKFHGQHLALPNELEVTQAPYISQLIMEVVNNVAAEVIKPIRPIATIDYFELTNFLFPN